MRKKFSVAATLALIMLLASAISARAEEWRFSLGLTYASGFSDVVDLYVEDLQHLGYSVTEKSESPLGISAHPYYQYENGFGVGGGLGPVMAIVAEQYTLLIVPVSADVRYVFNPAGETSPYLRAGVRYNLTSGDFVEGASPGLFGAAGVELLRQKDRKLHGGVELAYDMSTIEMKNLKKNTTEDIKPVAFMVTAFITFF